MRLSLTDFNIREIILFSVSFLMQTKFSLYLIVWFQGSQKLSEMAIYHTTVTSKMKVSDRELPYP